MDLGKYITGFLVFGLFVVALISFGVNIGTENSADKLITDNSSAISTIYSGVNRTIYASNQNASDNFDAFNQPAENTGVLSSISEFFISSILSIGSTIMSVANALFGVTFLPLLKAIGLPTQVARIVGIVVSMILLWALILMGWKLYRTGV